MIHIVTKAEFKQYFIRSVKYMQNMSTVLSWVKVFSLRSEHMKIITRPFIFPKRGRLRQPATIDPTCTYVLNIHYSWVDWGSVEYEVWLTLLHMTSFRNRSLDLLILSPTPYLLGYDQLGDHDLVTMGFSKQSSNRPYLIWDIVCLCYI